MPNNLKAWAMRKNFHTHTQHKKIKAKIPSSCFWVNSKAFDNSLWRCPPWTTCLNLLSKSISTTASFADLLASANKRFAATVASPSATSAMAAFTERLLPLTWIEPVLMEMIDSEVLQGWSLYTFLVHRNLGTTVQHLKDATPPLVHWRGTTPPLGVAQPNSGSSVPGKWMPSTFYAHQSLSHAKK